MTEQCVDQLEKLHNPLVTSQILITYLSVLSLTSSMRRREEDEPFSRKVKSLSYDLIINFLGTCLEGMISITGSKPSMKAWSSSLITGSYWPIYQLASYQPTTAYQGRREYNLAKKVISGRWLLIRASNLVLSIESLLRPFRSRSSIRWASFQARSLTL